MRDENRELLEEIIGSTLQEAKDAAPGSKEQEAALKQATILIEKLNNIEKLDTDYEKNATTLSIEKEKFEMQLEFEKEKFEKQKELELIKIQKQQDFEKEKFEKEQEFKKESDKKNRWVQIGIAVGSVICGGVYALFQRGCMRESMEFEQADSFTTTAGKSVTRDLFHFKKK